MNWAISKLGWEGIWGHKSGRRPSANSRLFALLYPFTHKPARFDVKMATFNGSSNGPVNVQNSFSIYAIYADAGVSAPLVLLFSFKFAFCLFCSLTNLDLAYITWKNLKSLSSSCNLLIGVSGLANGLMALNSSIALFVTGSGRNFIPVMDCTRAQTIFLWAFFFSSGATLLIGIDRVLAVSAPFWYTSKEKKRSKKALYLLVGLSLCAVYSTLFVTIAHVASMGNPEKPVICALADPMGDRIGMVVMVLELVSLLTVLCYIAIWLLMRLKKLGTNEQSRTIFKCLFLIISMELLGWVTYYSIRTILSPIALIFKLEPLETWFAMNAYSCVPYIAVGMGPLILFRYNKEYRNAFIRQWTSLGDVVGSVTIGGMGTVKEMNQRMGAAGSKVSNVPTAVLY